MLPAGILRRITDTADVGLHVGAVLEELQARHGVLQIDDVFDLIRREIVPAQHLDRDRRRRLGCQTTLGADRDLFELIRSILRQCECPTFLRVRWLRRTHRVRR